MNSDARRNRAWLLATAKAVATELKLHSKGTRLRIRIPSRAALVDTDGWVVAIGDLGKTQPRLEIWFDRFSGYPERKLYAGFCSETRAQMNSITKGISRKLWPARVVTNEHISKEKYLVLNDRLARSEFNMPILEKYRRGRTYYGIFDLTRVSAERVSPHFCARAVAFFEDVARTLPHASVHDEQREAYPRFENRKRVASHLQRERSRLLATDCKIRDNYICQVCSLRFEDMYGTLGLEFAEAHHRVPLSELREDIRTSVKDLVTVCSNCHRMLHRMTGKRNDVSKLKDLLRKRT